jgi:RND family efflux transporter MFP subunit
MDALRKSRMDSPTSSERATRPQRGFVRAFLVAGIVVAAIVSWAVVSAHRARASRQEVTDSQAVVTVATTRPRAAANGAEITLPGSVQANVEAPIHARTSGYLKRWLVDIGTQVEAGQVLGEIDAPEIDQQLRQAEADLETARTNRQIAEITAERWRGLRATDSVSEQEADEKISLAATAAAQVLAAEANVQRLRELAGFKQIVAPFAGVVTTRNTDVGQLISAGDSSGPELFRIADTSRLRLYVHVPQTYAAAMRPGLIARVQFPDRPGKLYEAVLERTAGALEASSRTLLAQLTIDNEQHELLPGAYAEVHFQIASDNASQAVVIPANTLLFHGDGLQVATVDADHRVVMKPVTLGRDYGTEIEVVHGLDKDDDVIINPPDSLRDRAEVRFAETTPVAAAES